MEAAPANDASSLGTLPILAADGERTGRLPAHHRDPFDRMLVAQALRLGAVIVTRDTAVAPYGVDALTA
jgi:PIN domain nuclease of toxin-antitoxin system